MTKVAKLSSFELAFEATYQRIRDELIESVPQDLPEVREWFGKMIEYNLPHGKRNRGLYLTLCYQMLQPNADEQQMERARILGWCVEILQAYFLIHDDMMDGSITRRGLPCWYRKPEVGTIAINDGILLESVIYQLLERHFGSEKCYVHLMNLFHQINQFTIFGQCSDLLSNKPGSAQIDFNIYTRTRYNAIVTYKTSYYSFSLPARAALYLAGLTDVHLHQETERIMVKMGIFFQIQDDYLDVFADPRTLGKIGTDIQDGKCSWVVVTALEMASPAQKSRLQVNYGQDDARCVATIKKLFHELGIPRLYEQLEENSYRELMRMITQLTRELNYLPVGIFSEYLHMVYKRQK